ncbi:MAG: pirin family protein [Cyanobacteria bacterium P01_F01_bin.53]
MQLITPHVKDLGGFSVRRSLPQEDFKMVGPFIFFDHLGPATFGPDQGIDVRPHPHINLATVTYLFEGAMMHRDSLGTVQEITPGAVNWMTAGQGIVHSERSPDHFREQTATLHGIQTWLALPEDKEETHPTFHHYPATDLPEWTQNGATIKVIAGELGELTSPVQTCSPTLYCDVQIAQGGTFILPAAYSEQAVYSVTAGLSIGSEPLAKHRLAVLETGKPVELTANETARCIVIGGEPLGERIKYWNFVSSRPERIEQAKEDWRNQQFDPVPQENEFIPLPDTVTE